MSKIPSVISEVVTKNLCIGCGACVAQCPTSTLEMVWSKDGFLLAEDVGKKCDQCEECVQVCPFNTRLEAYELNEDVLAREFLCDATSYEPKIGKFTELYSGYSKKYRATSSSGGLGTYFYEKLLESGIVDYLVTVGLNSGKDGYEYAVLRADQNLKSISKTRYYPVTMADVLGVIKGLDGRVAISGVGCFVKAIRLLQKRDDDLRDKIRFIVGIICGGVKSKFFTEYLVSKAGGTLGEYTQPEYRVKSEVGKAGDYSFCFTNAHPPGKKFIEMKIVGDMWGTGLFKANSCDFCDDVTTELADVSLGDAWMKPYNDDPLGNNVIVTRSAIANGIIKSGIANGDLVLDALPIADFLRSQRGSFNHRHNALPTRVEWESRRPNSLVPKKRVSGGKLSWHLYIVQGLRRLTRSKSLEIWRNERDANSFDAKMSKYLHLLKFIMRISQRFRGF